MEANAILLPVFAMGTLTLVMTAWMYATRIPALAKAGLDAQHAAHTVSLKSLPSEVVRVADNYDNLFEQPTLFYAVAIALAVSGQVDGVHLACAWAFTAFRVAHSVVQATINIVALRFALFSLAWIALGVMVLRGLITLM